VSQVRVNQTAIRLFLAGHAPARAGRNPLRRPAEQLAAQMVAKARRNASGEILRQRSGTLAASVVPIIRQDPVSGVFEVGVGSTAPYSDFLESGTTGPYPIVPHPPRRFLASRADNPDPLRNPQRSVEHPGIVGKHWLRAAVNSVIGRWPG
jgi:hypothetical protein